MWHIFHNQWVLCTLLLIWVPCVSSAVPCVWSIQIASSMLCVSYASGYTCATVAWQSVHRCYTTWITYTSSYRPKRDLSHTHLLTHTPAHTHIHTHTYTHLYTRTYTYTYTHTDTYLFIPSVMCCSKSALSLYDVKLLYFIY